MHVEFDLHIFEGNKIIIWWFKMKTYEIIAITSLFSTKSTIILSFLFKPLGHPDTVQVNTSEQSGISSDR
jgi:hypothetical protein